METKQIDRLFLELSQFTQAKTARELLLEQRIREIANAESWEDQSAWAELALADIEERQPASFATDWLEGGK